MYMHVVMHCTLPAHFSTLWRFSDLLSTAGDSYGSGLAGTVDLSSQYTWVTATWSGGKYTREREREVKQMTTSKADLPLPLSCSPPSDLAHRCDKVQHTCGSGNRDFAHIPVHTADSDRHSTARDEKELTQTDRQTDRETNFSLALMTSTLLHDRALGIAQIL